MKEGQEFLVWRMRPWLAFATLLVMAGCATSGPFIGDGDLPAKVWILKGQARWCPKEGNAWEDLSVGTVLQPGARVQTAFDSMIFINVGKPEILEPRTVWDKGALYTPKVPRSTIVCLRQNALLRLERLAGKRTKPWRPIEEHVRLDLLAGPIFVAAEDMPGNSQFELKVFEGVVRTGKGTFEITSDGYLKVLSGTASITLDPPLKTVEVQSGSRYNLRTDVLSPIPDVDY